MGNLCFKIDVQKVLNLLNAHVIKRIEEIRVLDINIAHQWMGIPRSQSSAAIIPHISDNATTYTVNIPVGIFKHPMTMIRGIRICELLQ